MNEVKTISYKSNQMESLNIKNMKTEINYSVERLNSTVDVALQQIRKVGKH